MKLFIMIFVFCSFLDVSWAQVERKEVKLQNGSTEIRVVYGEEGRYFVDTFIVDTDGWQDRKEQKSFPSFTEAKKYFTLHTHGYSSTSSLTQQFRVARRNLPLWSVTNQWNAEWEAHYSDWVRQNVDKNFFVKYQIPTDCADVAFALRWIFARISGLPAAVTLAGSQMLFTQDDGKEAWSSLATSTNWYEDQRFRTALLYVMNNTFTHTLLVDSYPVEISPIGVQPGGYYLTVRTQSGHTRLIYSTNPNDTALNAIRFVASDVPAEIRELAEEPFSLKKFLPKEAGGFLRFRWPRLDQQGRYILVPEEEMPNYSLDQYGKDFEKSYYNTVMKRMGITNKPEEFIRLRLELAWQKLKYRVGVVQKGFFICSISDCSPGTLLYEDWGTPSRDHQIYDLISEALETYWENPKNQKVLAEYDRWKDLQLDIGDSSGALIDYQDLMQTWYDQKYSSDPSQSILVRWGR